MNKVFLIVWLAGCYAALLAAQYVQYLGIEARTGIWYESAAWLMNAAMAFSLSTVYLVAIGTFRKERDLIYTGAGSALYAAVIWKSFATSQSEAILYVAGFDILVLVALFTPLVRLAWLYFCALMAYMCVREREGS